MIPTRRFQKYKHSRVLGVNNRELLLLTSSLVPYEQIDYGITSLDIGNYIDDIVTYLHYEYRHCCKVYFAFLVTSGFSVVKVCNVTRDYSFSVIHPQELVVVTIERIPFTELI